MTEACDIRMRFVKAWGHPTRDQIFGPGDIVWVSRWIADRLQSGGYAEEIEKEVHV